MSWWTFRDLCVGVGHNCKSRKTDEPIEPGVQSNLAKECIAAHIPFAWFINFTMVRHMFPSKMAVLVRRSGTPSNTRSLLPARVFPKWHLDRFIHFCTAHRGVPRTRHPQTTLRATCVRTSASTQYALHACGWWRPTKFCTVYCFVLAWLGDEVLITKLFYTEYY